MAENTSGQQLSEGKLQEKKSDTGVPYPTQFNLDIFPSVQYEQSENQDSSHSKHQLPMAPLGFTLPSRDIPVDDDVAGGLSNDFFSPLLDIKSGSLANPQVTQEGHGGQSALTKDNASRNEQKEKLPKCQ